MCHDILKMIITITCTQSLFMQPTTPEEVAKENPHNSLQFVAFIGERQTQYYILVEQFCQVAFISRYFDSHLRFLL